jgi:hypothetical protein
MFLTVPKGKNVSIVCRVSSDPVSQITWYFNGMPLSEDDAEMNLQVQIGLDKSDVPYKASFKFDTVR